VIIGTKEIEENTCVLKDIRSGEQQTISINNLLHYKF
jgi:histidyl-tRNA synthetase